MRDHRINTMSDANEARVPRTNVESPAPAVQRGSDEVDRESPDLKSGAVDRRASERPNRWRLPLLMLGPIILIVGALCLYLATGRYINEEDAYIQAVSVSMSPQVSGQVVAIAARSNIPVKKSDILFNLDPEPYRIALANAEGQLGAARDQVNTLIETYRSRLRQIDEARATESYAQTNFERQQHLYETGAGPRTALDTATRDLEVAKANQASLQREAAAALAQLGGNPDMPVEQQATVKQARAAVDLAARNLRLTTIASPFDGIPDNVESIAVGAFLNAGQAAFPLVSTHDLYVEANIRETDLTYVREGNSAQTTVDAYPDSPISGKVTSLAPASGSVFALLPPQNATGNWVKVVQRIPVRLSVGELPHGLVLRAGMSVKVSIDTGHRRSLRELWRDITSIFGA